MRLDDFDFDLPPELIAQEPVTPRDASRLLVLERASGAITECRFAEVSTFFRPGDLLVINDTRVIPARLHGVKESGGRVEIFLVRRETGDGERWRCLLKSSKPPRPGGRISLSGGVTASVEARDDDNWLVSFAPAEGFADWLEEAGEVPLPPYIRRQAGAVDREQYQTVFARTAGAVAAPTAGLHVTSRLLEEIREQGAEVTTLTLHVGLGTFLPVRTEDLREHRLHREWYGMPAITAAAVNRRKLEGGRVFALGTTTTRALEHATTDDGTVAGEGETDLFIYPGYRFRAVDALITNFHLPRSTLLMLVAAFAGREKVLRAYAEAVQHRFRFYSYGDAMLIL